MSKLIDIMPLMQGGTVVFTPTVPADNLEVNSFGGGTSEHILALGPANVSFTDKLTMVFKVKPHKVIFNAGQQSFSKARTFMTLTQPVDKADGSRGVNTLKVEAAWDVDTSWDDKVMLLQVLSQLASDPASVESFSNQSIG